MDLEGGLGTSSSSRCHSPGKLMLQCTTLSPQTAFPGSLQMDGLHSHGTSQDGCDEEDSVSVHNAILDNSCSSSESLLHSASESPRSIVADGHSHVESVLAASDSQNVQHWSYEEQFRQLYNLSPEIERKTFLDKLFGYMQKKGTPITRIPIMAKQPLDMYRLFKLVVERGGLVEVIKKKAWRDIAKELNLPASITSAAFTMRSQYVKYLYPFECEEKKLSDPKDLQLAIESNKRDRRHSDNVEFLSNSRDGERREVSLTGAVGQQAPFTVAGNPNALQLITSPTVAIPQSSLPPFSGGFIIGPSAGGTHMVHAPRLTPQLVQMGGANHPHVPIIVPTSMSGNPSSFTTMISVKPEMLCSPTTIISQRGERKLDDTSHQQDRPSPVWNNSSIPNLIQITHKSNESLVPTIVLDRNHEEAQLDSEDEVPPPAKRKAMEMGVARSSSMTPTTGSVHTLGMPFTNISIKPARSGSGSTEMSPSVLVTLELNETVYQGVLFARPRIATSPSR